MSSTLSLKAVRDLLSMIVIFSSALPSKSSCCEHANFDKFSVLIVVFFLR